MGIGARRHADRRRNVISITPVGTAHLRRLEELLADVQDELLTPLSPAERQQLIVLLNRILGHHDCTQARDSWSCR
jgi:MarR family transcriptional regulator, lower aerobic nicotinate degradation pathway regulator